MCRETAAISFLFCSRWEMQRKLCKLVLTSKLGTCIMMTIKLGKRRMGGLYEQRRNLSKEPERECREE